MHLLRQLRNSAITHNVTVYRFEQAGYGGMTIGYSEIPAGTDLKPLLQGLENDSCHCPHWGYMLEGTIRMMYDDGSDEAHQAMLEKRRASKVPTW